MEQSSVVYVVCPYYYKTGGTELSHQLVNELNKQNIKACIAYYSTDGFEKKINPEFYKYVKNFVDIKEINDVEKNIVVFPEIRQDLLNKYKNVQKCVWWMSVDNYTKIFKNKVKADSNLIENFLNLLKRIARKKKYKIDRKATHFYQSEYARNFLLDHKLKNIYQLSDYISDEYRNIDSDCYSNKENQVLFNPKKGSYFTKKIMQYLPNLEWIPIENLNTEGVKKLLVESKLYIDFGNHPGKDRFPREAVACGCCLITNKRGSAKYFKDIPIPRKYKFDDNLENLNEISKMINECLKNYDDLKGDFDEYRLSITNEKQLFKNNVADIFIKK